VSTSSWLAFTPRDTVFVRDGRSFEAAADATAETVLPGPTTMAGAVGAALGVRLSRDELRAALAGHGSGAPAVEEVRGPVLARRSDGAWEAYFPFPADLMVTPGEEEPYVYRLAPRKLAGATDLGMERWLVPPDNLADLEPLRGWIPGHVLAEYLAGGLPSSDGSPLADFEPLTRGNEPPHAGNLADPFRPEARVGLARDDRQARPGFLFQASHLRLAEDWAFLAEYAAGRRGNRLDTSYVPFGGRGRLADVEAAAVSWPAPGRTGKKVLVYLATPAVWPGGWKLPLRAGARLVAAAAGEPQATATVRPGEGWERTRELRWAVPAGSVYLLEFGDATSGMAWAGAWHGRALDRGVEEPDLLRTAGFGVALTGAWSD
jgi:CRISPR-associated protein Cmr3